MRLSRSQSSACCALLLALNEQTETMPPDKPPRDFVDLDALILDGETDPRLIAREVEAEINAREAFGVPLKAPCRVRIVDYDANGLIHNVRMVMTLHRNADGRWRRAV